MASFLKPGEKKYTILAMLYGTMLTMAPILSNRIVEIFDLKILLGAIVVVMAMELIDVVNNDFGIKRARDVIVGALVVRLFMWALVGLLMLLPFASETPGYVKMISSSIQLLLAGEIALFVSQYFVDTKIFDKMKQWAKSFWVRYLFSNIASYTLSLAIFLPLAFWGRDVDLMPIFLGMLAMRMVLQAVLAPIYSLLAYNKGE